MGIFSNFGEWFNGMFTRPDGFTPLYGYQMIERTTPVLIDTTYGKLWQVFCESPHLQIVIGRGAEMFGNADIKLIDKNGKEIEQHEVLTLLKQPTPLWSMEEWLQWIWVMRAVYGNAFIYQLKAFSNSTPAALWVLPSWDMKVIPTGKIYKQSKIEEIIKSYDRISVTESYTPAEIIHLVNGIGIDPLIGQSNIPGLAYHISNCNAALKSRNINLTEMGPKGILGGGSKDSDGGIGLSKKERERLEKEWVTEYGIAKKQRRISFTTAQVSWTPISYPTGEMMMFEETEDNFQAICGRYNMHRHIFPTVDGATYENAKQAERGTYQSSIQPFADSLASKLTKRFEARLPQGSHLEFDYSWLPVMQANRKEEAETFKANSESVQGLVSANIITPLQAQAILMKITGVSVDESLKNSNVLIERLTELSPLVANNMISSMTINEVRNILGLPAVADGDRLISASPVNPTVTV